MTESQTPECLGSIGLDCTLGCLLFADKTSSVNITAVLNIESVDSDLTSVRSALSFPLLALSFHTVPPRS